PVIGQLYRSFGGEGVAFASARLVLVMLALLPPAALMGATLPVLVAHVERDRVGAGLARLYALNTLGAVAGSLAAGFVLLPGVGLTATTFVAAGLNVGVAAVAWSAGRRAPAAAAPADLSAAAAAPPLDAGARRVMAALFALSGFGALAFQMAWVRLFGLVFGSSVYSFPRCSASTCSGSRWVRHSWARASRASARSPASARSSSCSPPPRRSRSRRSRGCRSACSTWARAPAPTGADCCSPRWAPWR